MPRSRHNTMFLYVFITCPLFYNIGTVPQYFEDIPSYKIDWQNMHVTKYNN